jgi:hypothetical protein
MAAASPSARDSYRDSVEQTAEPECEALSCGQVHRTAWCCPRAGRCGSPSRLCGERHGPPGGARPGPGDEPRARPSAGSTCRPLGWGARKSADLRAVVSNVELQRPAPIGGYVRTGRGPAAVAERDRNASPLSSLPSLYDDRCGRTWELRRTYHPRLKCCPPMDGAHLAALIAPPSACLPGRGQQVLRIDLAWIAGGTSPGIALGTKVICTGFHKVPGRDLFWNVRDVGHVRLKRWQRGRDAWSRSFRM